MIEEFVQLDLDEEWKLIQLRRKDIRLTSKIWTLIECHHWIRIDQ